MSAPDIIYHFVLADINECKATGMCTNGKCVNMMGMYKCDCNPGYVPNKEMNACLGRYICIARFCAATFPGPSWHKDLSRFSTEIVLQYKHG